MPTLISRIVGCIKSVVFITILADTKSTLSALPHTKIANTCIQGYLDPLQRYLSVNHVVRNALRGNDVISFYATAHVGCLGKTIDDEATPRFPKQK